MIKLSESIKWVITDFDGIMTDNCAYISDDGVISRKLNFKDIMGVSILKKNGFNIAIISGEKNYAIETLAKRFQIEEVYQNIRIKIDVLKSIVEKYNLSLDEFVYIGDDVNDLACMEYAKYKVTVPHAVKKVRDVSNIQVTEAEGGAGAFREVVDCLVG